MYSAELAQPELVKNNYIATVCTFAQNMSDAQDLISQPKKQGC